MLKKYIIGLGVVALSTAFYACKSDGNSADGQETTEQAVEADGHEGHNHGDGEHNHDHGQGDQGKYIDFDGDGTISEKEKTKYDAVLAAEKNPATAGGDISAKGLPNPCKLLTTEWLVKNTGMKVVSPRFKEGTKIPQADNRSCFVQWDVDGDPNAGFLVNAMINPVPEEIVDWPEVFIQAKINDGESMMDSDKALPYKRIKGLGVEAIGCYELGKYYWRQDNEHLFMLAYNLNVSEKAQRDLTVKIGNEFMKNFNAVLKSSAKK